MCLECLSIAFLSLFAKTEMPSCNEPDIAMSSLYKVFGRQSSGSLFFYVNRRKIELILFEGAERYR